MPAKLFTRPVFTDVCSQIVGEAKVRVDGDRPQTGHQQGRVITVLFQGVQGFLGKKVCKDFRQAVVKPTRVVFGLYLAGGKTAHGEIG